MIHLAIAAALLAAIHFSSFFVLIERKYPLRKTILLYGAAAAGFVALVVLLMGIVFRDSRIPAAVSAYAATITLGFGVFCATSADVLPKKVFLFVSYSNMFCIFSTFSIIVTLTVFPDRPVYVQNYIKLAVIALLFAAFGFVYVRHVRPTVLSLQESRKTWHSIALESLLFLPVFTLLFVFCRDDYLRPAFQWIFFLSVVLYIGGMGVAFQGILYIRNATRSELVAKNVSYLRSQLELAMKNEALERTIRHDFRHHSQNVATMLRAGKVEEALRYIDRYEESLDAARAKKFCPNVTVDAILNRFYAESQEEGLLFLAVADAEEDSPIADMDYVAMLSNMLENAFNGRKECASRDVIRFHLRTVGRKVVIVCSNPCCRELEIEDGMLKKRGVGMESMMAAARKYGGDIRYEKEAGRLTVCLILNP